ncbi:MAG TPA: T9SS type A sorting domain-containing protein [Bacteroidia bacterium]|jgi:hypothetical protein
MICKQLLTAVLFLLPFSITSQVWVEGILNSNAALVEKSTELKERSQYRSGGSITDTLSIDVKGFRDDFSYEGPYPDTAKWLNNYVFINRTLPIAPPTLGVATFDGLNASGYPYNFSSSSGSTGKADTLTSKPINLDFPGDTSVYFSFYYQAQGRGNYPDIADSIILEFKKPVAGSWHHVWAKKGLTSAVSDSVWKLVMIKITDPDFLKNGFQFRFSNWATLSGNGDHWHIDEVYLNRNRFAADTVFEDAAFVYNTPSLIKTYYAMPWRQYDSTLYKKTRYTTYIRNNDNTLHSGAFGYRIYDANNNQVNTTYTGGGLDFYPFSSVGYIDGVNDSACAFPRLNYVIPSPLPGRTEYTIESFIDSSPNDTLPSDTVRHVQVFDNYFAYDDGSAEGTFGLAGVPHAQIANKFLINVPDTLRCIDIYFNPQWVNAELYTFRLKVWLASGNGPGTAVYINPSLSTPAYNETGHDKFTRYCLDQPLFLSTGNFFIGFDQTGSDPINIGVDRNTNTQTKIFYQTTGGWYNPPYTGSLMMRPVIGSSADLVGINPAETDQAVAVFPNPANDYLFVNAEAFKTSSARYSILDLAGRTVIENGLDTGGIDVSGLVNGIYFIRIQFVKASAVRKFIISR